MFVDRIKIFAQAGEGGRGCVSFRREKFVPKGGPDGGDGGRGGDVILRADQHTDHLAQFFYEPIVKAKNGGHGRGKKMHGKNAPNKIVRVPVGTIVYQAADCGRRIENGESDIPNNSRNASDKKEIEGPRSSHERSIDRQSRVGDPQYELDVLADFTCDRQE